MNPKCEICQSRPAEYFQPTCCGEHEISEFNRWRFLCASCGDDTFGCLVSINEFFRSRKEQADWLFHLSTKKWVNMIEFRGMLQRWVLAGGRKPYPAR